MLQIGECAQHDISNAEYRNKESKFQNRQFQLDVNIEFENQNDM